MEESGFRIISDFSNTEDSDVAYIEGEKAIYINKYDCNLSISFFY